MCAPLLVGPGGGSRDPRYTRYTRYVDDRRMLRSHASAMILPALRTLADDAADDVLLVCPGVVYRLVRLGHHQGKDRPGIPCVELEEAETQLGDRQVAANLLQRQGLN